MGSIPAWLYRHQVTVEPFVEQGPFEPVYGVPGTVRCFVAEKRRLVRDATGVEVVSETTVFMPLDTVCPPESRITLPSGRITFAITDAHQDGGGLATPDHLEVALQ